jgi:hypothetical protein
MKGMRGIPVLRTGLMAVTSNRDKDRPSLDKMSGDLGLLDDGEARTQRISTDKDPKESRITAMADKRKSRLGTTVHLQKRLEFSATDREIIYREGYINFILMRYGKVWLSDAENG